jgi:hypothetical protein
MYRCTVVSVCDRHATSSHNPWKTFSCSCVGGVVSCVTSSWSDCSVVKWSEVKWSEVVEFRKLCVIVLVFSLSVMEASYGSAGSGKLKFDFHKSCYVYTWLQRVKYDHVIITHLEEMQILENMKCYIDETAWRRDKYFYARSSDCRFIVHESYHCTRDTRTFVQHERVCAG